MTTTNKTPDTLQTKVRAALAAKKIATTLRADGSIEVQDGSFGVLHFGPSGYVGPSRTVRASVAKLVMRVING